MKKTFAALLFLAGCAMSAHALTLRVLAIGNSFSQDAVEQNLYELANANGDTLIIGNAYIPGCPVDKHLDNILEDKDAYSYRKVVDGVKTKTDNTTLKSIITDEPWDIISLQQASHFSGKKDTYANLPRLKAEVIKQMPVKDARIVWHMTWAYSMDSDHSGFKYYGNSQSAMNDSIYAAVCTEMPRNNISEIIPAGQAIQNAREIFGDVLNSDGYHLSHVLGRYVAALTWWEFLSGESVIGNPYHPESLSDEDALKAQQAAHRAVQEFKLR